MRKSLMPESFLPAVLFICLLCCAQSSCAQRSDRSFSSAELSRYKTEAGLCTIIRDKWGIPHIYGKKDADVVFGLMYAECEEDFSRLEKNYLEMLGRQAEAYGEGYLYYDLQMRLIYDSVAAKNDYRNSPPWMHRLLDAAADGVNFYLYTHPETKPLVLRRFEPWFPLMFTDGSVSATSTGGISLSELKDFYGQDHSVAEGSGFSRGPAAEVSNGATREVEAPETGSNGFAIAPARTASGNAMLYINPHVPFYFRMEVQLISDEGLNAYGAVTWGQFFVYQGFNAHCGWMHTSSYVDVADLYEEKVRPGKGSWMAEYQGEWQPVTGKPMTLWYRSDSGGIKSLTVTGYYTRHGPVMGSRNGKWLSLKEYNRSLNALIEAWQITKANNFSEYKTAMGIRANTTNNTVYADDQGNIAYWHGNFMPKRDTAYNWLQPVDGTVSATEWKGLHELDEIVHVYNPATGWIENCNSTPFTSSGISSPDRTKYPRYMAPDGQNFRALNAARLLGDAHGLTLDSLIAKGYDHYLTAFDRLLPPLFQAYAERSADPGSVGGVGGVGDSLEAALREPIGVLRQWDKRSGVNSVATTLAIEWAGRMAKYAPKPATIEEATDALSAVDGEMRRSTATEKLYELSAVIDDLKTRFGDWKIAWGEVCRYQRLTGKITETYDDSEPSLPSGLVYSAFGALPSFQSRVMNGTKRRYGYSGNSFIAAVEFGKRIRAKTVITGGESSDPVSAHFSDQAAMYLDGKFKEVLFYKEDVLNNMETKYHPGEKYPGGKYAGKK
jgi:acyl-homoserine-lactone acylase